MLHSLPLPCHVLLPVLYIPYYLYFPISLHSHAFLLRPFTYCPPPPLFFHVVLFSSLHFLLLACLLLPILPIFSPARSVCSLLSLLYLEGILEGAMCPRPWDQGGGRGTAGTVDAVGGILMAEGAGALWGLVPGAWCH